MNRIIRIKKIEMVMCPKYKVMQPIREHSALADGALGCLKCKCNIRIDSGSVVCSYEEE